jgi:hypothetical protein
MSGLDVEGNDPAETFSTFAWYLSDKYEKDALE